MCLNAHYRVKFRFLRLITIKCSDLTTGSWKTAKSKVKVLVVGTARKLTGAGAITSLSISTCMACIGPDLVEKCCYIRCCCQDVEEVVIYNVGREEYQSCSVMSAQPRIVAYCTQPHQKK